MRSAKRVIHVITGVIMILCSIVLFLFPEDGYLFVILILDITLLSAGIRLLVYYFTMARFMTGGIALLYRGMILFDFGMFVFGMHEVPHAFAMLYLLGCLFYSGIFDILHSIDAKRLKASFWKYEFFYGSAQLVLAIISLFFIHSVKILTDIYCIGLLHSAVSHIATAFRKTAIVYIDPYP